VQPADAAARLSKFLLERAAGTRAWLGGADRVDGGGIDHDLGDGSAVLRPAVHELDRPDAPQAGTELPFPCVWVAPWTRADGRGPLRDSLVLTALTGDEDLIDELVSDPTIGNVYLGDQPTHRIVPGIPHDDYLAGFLMRSKAFIRDRHGATG
jgi:hypothetical protein